MSETLDLDAARARRIESSGESLHFTFGGEDFTVPPTKEWELDIPETMAAGQMTEALKMLLGEEQAERFMGHRPRIGDLEALSEWLAEQATGGSGN